MLFLPIKQNSIKAETISLCMILSNTYKIFRQLKNVTSLFCLGVEAFYDSLVYISVICISEKKTKLKNIFLSQKWMFIELI